MPQTTIVIQLTKTIAQTTLVESIRDGIVDFLADQAQDLGKKEISGRIAKLRSDAKLRAQIHQALERATGRWATDHPDRDLVAAVAKNTTFTDLPSVQEAIRTVAQRPFDPIAAETLRGKFDDVLPQRFEPARVERGIAALLEFLREEFAGVSVLQQAQQVAAAIRTDRNTNQIVTLLEQMLSGPTPTQETLTNYLTWVIDQHRYLDPRGVRQTVRQVQVLLQDVYVSLTAEAEPALSATDRHLYEHELERMLARDDLQPEETEDLRENLLARYAQAEETRPRPEPVDLSDLVCEHPKLVILGDPGAGKTTLLRYLALLHAQALRHGVTEIAELGDTRLPLYLRIAEYAEHGNGRTLLNFLPTNVRGEDDSDETLALLIRDKLAAGTCLVLLDGLDEIIEPGQRAEIAAQIDALIRTHERTGNRFVVTSRVAGYRTVPLSGDIAHYRVCDMTTAQIRAFLEQWCHAVERFQTPDLSREARDEKACAEIESITQAIEDNPGVRALATNPLLLRTLALIHRTGARLPQRRIELYRLAADTLIRDWQLARGISEAALVKEAEATRLLAELAAWLHQEKPAGIATHGEVQAKLAEVKGRLDDKDPDHPDVLAAVDDFLERIRQYTGLFVERAPRRYGFMHLTFEEYFAARWLVARPRQAAHRIRNKLHRPRWQEPILLAVAFYGMEFPDDVDDLIEEAILGQDLGGPSPYEHILHRDLLFAVRCLGDQDVSAGLRQQLIARFTHCWLDQDQAGKYEPLREHCAQIAQALRGSEAETTLTESLIATLQDKSESEPVRRSAASALSDATARSDVVSALLAALTDDNEDVRSNAADALRNAMTQPDVVSALLAALTDDNEDVRSNAADALRNATTQPDVVSALLAALTDESAHVRRSAAYALYDAMAQPDVVSALLAAFTDESESVRTIAAFVLSDATTQPDVVSALLAAFTDESEGVRAFAAFVLSDAALSDEAVLALLAALTDESKDVRIGAAIALSNVTLAAEAVPALLAALTDESEDVRVSNFLALSNVTLAAEAVSALLAALTDESADVRRSAAQALDSSAALSDEAVPALLATLTDESEDVRGRAASALSDATAQPDVVSALLAALTDESEYVRVRAASALGNATAQPDVVSVLLAALQDKSESEDVRSRAASALHNATAQPDVVSALLAALTDDSASVRGSAASALSDATARPDVVSVLLAALQDKSESEDVRSRAASALHNATAQPDVVSALLAALTDESESVRGSAASALSDATARPDVISVLLAALTDESEDVRISAVFALSDATLTAEAVSALLAALTDESASVSGSADFVLSDATTQPDVVSALLAALTDESKDVRSRAADMLAKLTRRPAATALPGLPDQLAACLNPPGLDKQSSYTTFLARDSLFQALSVVAPPPQLD